MDNRNKISKGVLFGIIGVSVLLVVILVLAFVIFFTSPKEVKEEVINAGDVSMTYTDDFNGLSITNTVPVADDVGKTLEGADQYFDFTISTNVLSSATVEYEIALVKNKAISTISDNDIRIYLEKQSSGSYVNVFGPENFAGIDKKSKIGSPKGSMIVSKVTNEENITENYRLRMWLSDKSQVSTDVIQNYTVEVIVNGRAK